MKSFFFSQYLITDPHEFGNNKELIELNLSNSFQKHKIDMICFRDKESLDTNLLAKNVLDISKQNGIGKVLINSNIELAVELGFDGVHLTSLQFDEIQLAKQQNLYIIISCHSEYDVNNAKTLGCDAVSYSPIFYKENKGEPKGIENLRYIVNKYQSEDFKIIALGGIISDFEVNQVQSTNSSGFASIRYFKV